jgi:hypothetical protein
VVIAVVVLAVSGTAATAAHLITSAQIKNGTIKLVDISPRARTALHGARGFRGLPGQRGLQGPRGLPGQAGEAGATGATGLQGKPGDPAQFPQTLPSGRTETGDFSIRFNAAAAGQSGDDSISFALPLATAPTPVLGGSQNCTGTTANPTAPAGTLCLYYNQVTNVAARDVVNAMGAVASADRQGAVLDAVSSGAGDTLARGSWAVTAP